MPMMMMMMIIIIIIIIIIICCKIQDCITPCSDFVPNSMTISALFELPLALLRNIVPVRKRGLKCGGSS
jgi:hypothetical protein